MQPSENKPHSEQQGEAPQRQTSSPPSTSGQPGLPTRPPHPNTSLTAEMIAPLLKDRTDAVLRELASSLTAPRSNAFLVVQGGEFGPQARQQSSQQHEHASKRLALMNMIERAEAEISNAASTGTSESVLTIWHTLVAPLIDDTIELHKQHERKSFQLVDEISDGILSFLGSMQAYIEIDGETSELPDLPGMLRRLTSRLADVGRQSGKRERTLLSTLRYEPYAQLAECRLNEVALDLQLHDVAISMDEREPVVAIGEDDVKLAASFYAGCLKELHKEIQVGTFQKIIDPSSVLVGHDEEAFCESFDAMCDRRKIACTIRDKGHIDLSVEIPDLSFIDMQQTLQRFDINP